MPNECERRKPCFETGVDVRLSDGQLWSLPVPRSPRDDAEFNDLLKAVAEAEDLPERLQLELALTILLLGRNYELSSGETCMLLSFSPSDLGLPELQEDVRTLLARALSTTTLGPPEAGPSAIRHARARSGNGSPATKSQ